MKIYKTSFPRGKAYRCLSSELTSFAPKATIRAVTPVKWRIHQKCRPPRLDVSLDVRLAGSHYLIQLTIQLNHVIATALTILKRDFNSHNSMEGNGEIAIIYRRRNISSNSIVEQVDPQIRGSVVVIVSEKRFQKDFKVVILGKLEVYNKRKVRRKSSNETIQRSQTNVFS